MEIAKPSRRVVLQNYLFNPDNHVNPVKLALRAKLNGSGQQLTLKRSNLSLNHSVEVQFTAASKGKVLGAVSKYFGIRRVFKRSHEYEQRSRRLITSATDYF